MEGVPMENAALTPTLSWTPSRRRFGTSISVNTPPRESSSKITTHRSASHNESAPDMAGRSKPDLAATATVSFAPVRVAQSNSKRRRRTKTTKATTSTADGAQDTSTMQPSPPYATPSAVSAATGSAHSHRSAADHFLTPMPSTGQCPYLRTPGISDTELRVVGDSLLTPSVVRGIAARADAGGASPPKPRYTTLLQVLKSVSYGQNYVSHAFGTRITEKLTVALGGGRSPEDEAATTATLASRARLMEELSTATKASKDLFRLSLTEQKSDRQESLDSGRYQYGSVTDPKVLHRKSPMGTPTAPSTSTRLASLHFTPLMASSLSPKAAESLPLQMSNSTQMSAPPPIKNHCSSSPTMAALTSVKTRRIVDSHYNRTAESNSPLNQLLHTNLEDCTERRASALRLAEANAIIAHQRKQIESLEVKLIQDERDAPTRKDTKGAAALSNTDQLAQAFDEIDSLKSQVKLFEVSDRSSAREVGLLKKSNAELLSQVSRLKEALDNKEEQLSLKSSELLQHKSTLEDVRMEMFHKNEELKMAHRSVTKLQSKIAYLSSKMTTVTKQTQEEKSNLIKEIAGLREEISRMEKGRVDRDGIINSMRRNLAESETRAEELRDRITKEREATKRAQKLTEEVRTSIDHRISDAVLRLETQKQLNEKIMLEKTQLETTMISLRQTIRDDAAQISQLQAQLESSTIVQSSENKTLTANLLSERQKCKDLSDKLSKATLALARVQKELSSAKSLQEKQIMFQRSEADEKVQKLSTLVETKEKELQELRDEHNNLENDRKDSNVVQTFAKDTETEMKRDEYFFNELKEDFAKKIESMKATHQMELQRLIGDKHTLNNALQTSEEKRATTESRLSLIETSLNKARLDRERLLSEKHELEQELNRVKDVVQDLTSEIAKEKSGANDSGSDGELASLNCHDLKSVQDELKEARARLSEKEAQCERYDLRIKSSEQDMELLSNELKSLVRTNELLEATINEHQNSRDSSDHELSKLRTQAAKLEDARKENNSLLEQIDLLKERLQALKSASKTREQDARSAIKVMELRLETLTNEKKSIMTERETVSEALDTTRVQLMKANSKCKELEASVQSLQMRLDAASEQLELSNKQLEVLQTQVHDDGQSHHTDAELLEDECSRLRILNADLQGQLDQRHRQLGAAVEKEKRLLNKLDLKKTALNTSDKARESIESKLYHASEVIASQKESIASLEKRALEAEDAVLSLSKQVDSLQDSIRQKEKTSESSDTMRLLQLQKLEDTIAGLEEEQLLVRNENSILQDQLRDARSKCSDFEDQCKHLQSRFETTRHVLDKTTAENLEAKTKLEESMSSISALKAEVDMERTEIQHLTARIQLLDASIARLKSENLLLMDAKNQTEEAHREDVKKLLSAEKAKVRKLEALSELYHAHQELYFQSRSSRQTVSRSLNDVFGDVAVQTGSVANGGVSLQIKALDLANIGGRQMVRSQSSCKTVLLDAVTDLSTTFDMEHHSSRNIDEGFMTPPSKTTPLIPNTPAIMDALARVKRMLREELFSPDVARQVEKSPEDAKRFEGMMHSLEIQVEGLVFDLKSANEALRAKDRLFVDLEKLARHLHQERDALGLQLERHAAQIQELQERLELETLTKLDLEKRLAELTQESSEGQVADDTVIPPQPIIVGNFRLTAARQIAQFLENRCRRQQAHYFTQWACQAAVMKASEQQQHLADRLTEELNMTKEKVAVLKRHFEKNQRRRGSGLEMIAEDSETI